MKSKLARKDDSNKTDERKLILTDLPGSKEYEIEKKATDNKPAKKIRFPKEFSERYKLKPKEFANVQNAIDEYQREDREIKVFANSIESRVGYNSLHRVLGNFFGRQVAFCRSEKGGSLTFKEAREKVYRDSINDDEAICLLNKLLSLPTDQIGLKDLLELNGNSPLAAENLWEMIKREARGEFESGHRAAEVFEPADWMKDAWNRASYLGLRESLCEEWQPKGGIEMTMIDAIAEAWMLLQFWTKESVLRAKTEPREEDYEFQKWKQMSRKASPKQWGNGHWDKPSLSEQAAVEHTAQMADRWQRMYFRAVRNLRDWRRYTPQVTINNPAQVNIAAEGGQQINMSKQNSPNAIKS